MDVKTANRACRSETRPVVPESKTAGEMLKNCSFRSANYIDGRLASIGAEQNSAEAAVCTKELSEYIDGLLSQDPSTQLAQKKQREFILPAEDGSRLEITISSFDYGGLVGQSVFFKEMWPGDEQFASEKPRHKTASYSLLVKHDEANEEGPTLTKFVTDRGLFDHAIDRRMNQHLGREELDGIVKLIGLARPVEPKPWQEALVDSVLNLTTDDLSPVA